jgi:hypothetical protein
MNLSKSLYTKGIQCQKALWLKKYNKEVPTPLDEIALVRFETVKSGDSLLNYIVNKDRHLFDIVWFFYKL